MELNVDQIDLLDLALPSDPKGEHDDLRVSKGPPPLPPSLPPSDALPPVPSLPPPPLEVPTQPAAISARTLVGGPPNRTASLEGPNQLGRFLVGMGAATLLCVGAFFVFRAFHKVPPANAPVSSSTAGAGAPTRAFTMAPIEFTAPVGSAAEPEAATGASSAPSALSAPGSSPTVRAGAGGRPTSTAATGKPRSDDVIKVEN